MPAGAKAQITVARRVVVAARLKSCHTMQSPCKGCTVVGLSVCLKGRTHDVCMHCHNTGLVQVNQKTKASPQCHFSDSAWASIAAVVQN